MGVPIPFGEPRSSKRLRDTERELAELFNSVNTQSRCLEARGYIARKGVRVFNEAVDDIRIECGDDLTKQQFAVQVLTDLGQDLRSMMSGR